MSNSLALPHTYPQQRAATVVIAVPESDCHVVALTLLDWYLTRAGYCVINLGVTTTNQEIAQAVRTHTPVAVLISAQNGHAEFDLQNLHSLLRAQATELPILIGGRMSICGDDNTAALSVRFAKLGITVVDSFESALRMLMMLAPGHAARALPSPVQATV